ncbi:MAG: cofactor-independent phosphoglycerate mutase [Methanophagales archaeon ANME-1-THS]|nr:MAG: cofactor-independent phosphoglycerate mutase [Methanophagales archaeon ANME-1-THS]
MKYVILIGDGMADYPIPERGYKTALQIASTPNLDFIATTGIRGLVQTIPEGMNAGSDIAILSILGYDPARYYTGRGPIEAMGMHIHLERDEIAFRCNLVTEAEGRIVDYSGGHIPTEEARVLIKALNEALGVKGPRKGWELTFYPGVSYRNVLIINARSHEDELGEGKEIGSPPPHDVIGARVEDNLPKEAILREIMRTSKRILEDHEVNLRRMARNERKANMVWLWSGGKKPAMPAFSELYGVHGSVISGVDLIKGVGACVGLDTIEVPGATGYIDTNYKGKAEYALRSLEEKDFVLVHVEAPDEAAHLGDIALKVNAIEDFDALVVGTVLKGLEERYTDTDERYRLLVLPDHYTPVSVGTHTREAVPFAIYDSHAPRNTGHVRAMETKGGFDEVSASKSDVGVLDARAQDLMRFFFKSS